MPSVKASAAASASLKRLYGTQVVVRYHAIDTLETQQEWADMLAYFKDERLPLPVTLLNQELLFVGGLQPLKLVATVAQWFDHHGIKLDSGLPQVDAQDNDPYA